MSMLDSTLSTTIEIQPTILSWSGPSLEGVVMKTVTASPCNCQQVTDYSEVVRRNKLSTTGAEVGFWEVNGVHG
jgi:hypothetical protein